jgi:hypothetical protein
VVQEKEAMAHLCCWKGGRARRLKKSCAILCRELFEFGWLLLLLELPVKVSARQQQQKWPRKEVEKKI